MRSRMITTVLLLAAVGLAGPRAAGRSKKWALLIGINEYQDTRIRALRGGLNDVERMEDVLVRKFGFPVENILTLRNREATRDGILSAFQTRLVGSADAGDIAVFYYSGHGSQLLDGPDGDEEDGLDETIVPYDSSNSGNRDITDDRIRELIQALSTKNVLATFIFDSCNSGTLSRGAGEARFVQRDLPARQGTSTRGTGTAISGMKDGGAYTLIAAAGSAEVAREYASDDGVVSGALTYFLTEALSRAPGRATYRDVMDVVQQNVAAYNQLQHPRLEGTAADQLVFGATEVFQQKYVTVSPAESKSEVLLEAGKLHGVSAGSVFDVYPPGTRVFEPPEAPLVRGTVFEVMPRHAKARLQIERTVPAGSRAVEREHRYEDSQLYVSYEKVERSALLASIQRELDDYNFIHTARLGERYHLLVEDVDGTIVIEAAGGGVLARIDAGKPESKRLAVDRVKTWAKWFNVLSIRNPNPSPNVRIKFSITAETTRGETRSPFAHVERPEAELYEGEKILCVIESDSASDLYLNIVDLSTDGSVSWVYPRDGRQAVLPKGEKITVKLRTFVPDGFDSVTDVLKVFASVSPVEFGFLEQEPITRGETRGLGLGDPLAELVAAAALGARGSRDALRLDRWIVEERVLRVRRSR